MRRENFLGFYHSCHYVSGGYPRVGSSQGKGGPSMDRGTVLPRYKGPRKCRDTQMVIRSTITELCVPEVCQPRYCVRGNKPWTMDCACRGILPRQNRANEYSPDTFFSLQGQEHIALPRMDLVRQSELPRHSHAGVQKSAVFSFLLCLLRAGGGSQIGRASCRERV